MTLKFLFITATFWPCIGGTERRAALLGKSLVDRGHSVTVLTQGKRSGERSDDPPGLEIVRIPPPPGGRLSSALFALRTIPFFLRRGREFDLYQVFLASAPALFAGTWSSFSAVPAFLGLGGSGPTGDAGTSSATALGRWKIRRLKNSFRLFLCPNEAVRKEFLDLAYPPERLVLLAGGVDTSLYRPAGTEERKRLRERLGWTGRSVVIYTGRLERGKGLTSLLGAWGTVARRREALLVIAGDGRLRRHLEKRIREDGLEGTVHLPGFLGDEEIRGHLQGADAFVLPSQAEGMSNALLEAMSTGLAAVATDIPGTRDMLQEGENGILVAPRREEALANALESLLADDGARARLGRTARRTAVERYSSEKMTESYLALVDGALDGSGKGEGPAGS